MEDRSGGRAGEKIEGYRGALSKGRSGDHRGRLAVHRYARPEGSGAFDVETGKPLWEAEVGAGLEGMPAVYEAGGRQYIVFCAAAQEGLIPATQRPIQGSYVAFALPMPAQPPR